MPAKTSADLCSAFAEAVLSQDRCIDVGDAPTGSRYADTYTAAARTLLDRGGEAIEELARLLEHSSDSVRVMAAAFLLKDRTEKAVAALRPIARKPGIVALGARETLKRYARGDLSIKW